jgi:DNA segregation ATPase FtsK/SpoIIIE-like protein
MLFFPVGIPKPRRIQGAFIDDNEVERVTTFLKKNSKGVSYNEEIIEEIRKHGTQTNVSIFVDSDWAKNWGVSGAGNPSSAVAGGIDLDGGDNYKVATGGTYVAVLHANRTPYVLELVAQ